MGKRRHVPLMCEYVFLGFIVLGILAPLVAPAESSGTSRAGDVSLAGAVMVTTTSTYAGQTVEMTATTNSTREPTHYTRNLTDSATVGEAPNQPSQGPTPAGNVFYESTFGIPNVVWGILGVLIVVSAVLFWRRRGRTMFYYVSALLFVLAMALPLVIEFGREHGVDGLSVIFAPGRDSTENVLRVLTPALSLEVSLSFGMFFFILGRLGKPLTRSVYKRNLFAFFVPLLGFAASLYYTFISNMTGTATPLNALYVLIGILFAGFAFMTLTMDEIVSQL